MKKFILPILAALVFTLAACSNNSYEDPEKYLNDMVEKQSEVILKIDSLNRLLNANELNEMVVNGAIDDAITTTNKNMKFIDKMGAFNDDDNFRTASLNLMQTIKELLENEYEDIYNLYKKDILEWTDEDFYAMTDTWETIENKTISKKDAFETAQSAFADKHSILY